MNFQISLSDIVIIALSIVLPLIRYWRETLNRKIGLSIGEVYRYLNKAKLDEGEYYYRWHQELIPNQKEMIKFLTGKEPELNSLLLPGRSSRDNGLIKQYQEGMKKFSIEIVILNYVEYIVSAIIIILLLFTS